MIIRIVIALIFLPVFVYSFFMDNSLCYSCFIGLVVAWSLWEFCALMERKGFAPFKWWGMICGTLMAVSPEPRLVFFLSPYFSGKWELTGFLGAVFLIGALLVLLKKDIQKGAVNMLLTVGGVFYIGYLGSYLVLLRHLPLGSYFLFILYFFTWAYDGGAYFVGVTLGRHPLAPTISPKKTKEGFIGGFVLCGLFFCLIKLVIMPQMPISLLDGLILTVLLGFMGQMGDLSESVLKRYVGVKDSGALFPEYGGFLDKVDSLLFTAPCLYYYVLFIMHVK